ncbi:MAG TPA: hypothetical protein VHA57_00685, partial [Actinomycetota bacterium]|nr:hypothetical protein [Actinomycetota bacterium]
MRPRAKQDNYPQQERLTSLSVVDLASASAEYFEPLVGRQFHAGDLTLRLASVTRGEPQPGQPRTPFRLVFTGPRDRFLPQGTVRLAEETAGELDIFLVPIGMTNEVF